MSSKTNISTHTKYTPTSNNNSNTSNNNNNLTKRNINRSRVEEIKEIKERKSKVYWVYGSYYTQQRKKIDLGGFKHLVSMFNDKEEAKQCAINFHSRSKVRHSRESISVILEFEEGKELDPNMDILDRVVSVYFKDCMGRLKNSSPITIDKSKWLDYVKTKTCCNCCTIC